MTAIKEKKIPFQ